jgi:hypothetical protein
MSTGQKQAWFHLTVVVASVLLMLALTPAVGCKRSQAGLAVLGLMGFSPLLFRRRRASVQYDERDGQILARSWMIAYAVFWVIFVAATMAALWWYGPDGTVPVFLVVMSAWYAWIIVAGTSSVATLVQYARGGSVDA